ncbi:hypothetical protein TM5383_01947 [Thalassovita mediterranea]|jgi:hypothetical protein|uniref:Uncharacterized protein n=1 Tax=Thalassovita mediterranea TaxID=340021 RepID=A0A0P1GQ19_9RHOB|nr:hypothetical protein TM5383_01947 [Thalassovita mediterranea]SIS32460.1 hypothetical protein SAMN05421685_106192 [Thalassovita mediterranea]
MRMPALLGRLEDHAQSRGDIVIAAQLFSDLTPRHMAMM